MWERVHFLLVPDMPDSIRRVNQAFNHPGNKVDYSIIYIYTIILYIYICVCVYFHSCCMRTPQAYWLRSLCLPCLFSQSSCSSTGCHHTNLMASVPTMRPQPSPSGALKGLRRGSPPRKQISQESSVQGKCYRVIPSKGIRDVPHPQNDILSTAMSSTNAANYP